MHTTQAFTKRINTDKRIPEISFGHNNSLLLKVALIGLESMKTHKDIFMIITYLKL